MGGAFDHLHRGHKDLLDRACVVADHLLIGLCTDEFAGRGRDRRPRPYDQRHKALEDYLDQQHPGIPVEIVPLEDEFGPAGTGDFQAIVVSEATRDTAIGLNRTREAAKLGALRIIEVPHRLAQDGLPISSTRVARGELDPEGELLRPLLITVGSANPVKVEAVRKVCDRLYREVTHTSLGVPSGVPEQPRGIDETTRGAINRARGALKGDTDLGVGIEAGLIASPLKGEWLDVQYCAVVDRGGRMTLGHGAGFAYPTAIIRAVEAGRTVGQAMSAMTGIPDIGSKQGAIGYLSRNALDRQGLTGQAVLAAFIPRLRQEHYR